jgi:hypothetical protein
MLFSIKISAFPCLLLFLPCLKILHYSTPHYLCTRTILPTPNTTHTVPTHSTVKMKFTNAICVFILAASVSAVALPNPVADARCGHPGQPCGKRDAIPAPEARCGHPGQPCGKAKREPEARCGHPGQPCGKRDAIPEAEARCGHPGQPCGKVKRAAEAFAEALAEASATENVNLDARCNLVGGACFEAKRLTRDLAAVVAETQEDPEAYYNSLEIEDEETSDVVRREAEARCGHPGQPCGKAKRDARCGNPGQPCGKAKRDAEADPEAEARCGHPGQPCGKLRRAAEAVAEAVAEAEAEPEARCGHPGQPCGKAKRDAHAIAHAAEVALSSL